MEHFVRLNASEMRADPPRIAPGERIYAVGDIHGRLDLFEALVHLIRRDAGLRSEAGRTRLLLIGDLIDRGPHSAELVERLRAFGASGQDLIVLRGNHEQVMLDALDGDLETLARWMEFGGDATLRSWGVAEEVIAGPPGALLDVARAAVPPATLAWLGRLPLSYRSGDFFFVHAGIRPGVALRRQQARDMLWIKDAFLGHGGDHPCVIVHGHSIVEDGPAILPNRIALDTGAYRTGRLSAVGFEGDRHWAIST